ncbi:UNVERIFIED_CONTAM: hypothetical protein FKN15_022232 [Acipenser sinensis]
MKELVHELHSDIKDDVMGFITSHDTIRSKMEKSFDSFENPFTNFNTEAKWKKHFSE